MAQDIAELIWDPVSPCPGSAADRHLPQTPSSSQLWLASASLAYDQPSPGCTPARGSVSRRQRRAGGDLCAHAGGRFVISTKL